MFRTPACLVGLMLLAAVPSQAAQNAAPQITVSYSDLNLSQVADARILLARLETASHVVCGHQPDLRDLGAWQRFRVCSHAAMGRAVAAIHSPLVAQLYVNPEDVTGELMARRDPTP